MIKAAATKTVQCSLHFAVIAAHMDKSKE